MIRRTTNQHGKKIVGLKFGDPVGEAGKFAVKHEDKGTQDLWLVGSRSASVRVERDKEFAHGIKIHGSKFIPGIRHGIEFFEL